MIYEEMDFTDPKMLRKKAEKRLTEKRKEQNDKNKVTNGNKLLHELQVHQIELEMQYDELRQAYETAETALKKYIMVYELSPVGYLTLDSDGTICDLNFTAAELLGDRRFSLTDSNFKLFVSEESRTVFNDFFSKVYTSNSKESCVVLLGYNNKPLSKVYMEGVVTEDEQKCLLSVVDLSKFSNV
jgi:PAS domain-containing protein